MKFCFKLVLFFSIIILSISNCTFGQIKLQIEQIAKKIQGNTGVCVLILETGESQSYNNNRRFPMQSVYKLPIAMAILDGVDKGKFTLTQRIHIDKSAYIPKNGHSSIRDKFPGGTDLTLKELIRYNIEESDGTACDVLLKLLGGPKKAEQYIHSLGIKDIAISTTEMVQVANDFIQYQNWATPRAMTGLLKTLYTSSKISKQSRTLLLKLLTGFAPGARRLKGLLPIGTMVAHKTGTSGTINGLTRATNDVGIITLPNGRHLAISVFISDSTSPEKNRESTIAQISKAAFNWAASNHTFK